MGKGRIRGFTLALVMVAGLVGLATPAHAAPCGNGGIQQLLRDTDGWPWDLEASGSISDGVSDAFDSYAEIEVGGAAYPGAADDSCALEEDGREVVYPEETLAGLEVSRKVFVPATGAGFARFLSILRNAGAAPVTTTYTFGGNLGSNGNTFVFTTSSGDATVTTADRWAVSNDSDGDATQERFDPTVGTIWDGFAPGAAQTATTTTFVNGDDGPEFDYDVTVPPGSTFVFLHAVVQRESDASAVAAATELSAGLSDVFAGMSLAELSQLRNWALPTCQGSTITLAGTSGNDVLTGTEAADVILAGDGDDKISALGGNDTICAGGGNDRANGGGGKDVILGEDGNDNLKGAGGNDRLLGGPGNDTMNGGPGKKDTCKGGPGKDTAKACEKGKA